MLQIRKLFDLVSGAKKYLTLEDAFRVFNYVDADDDVNANQGVALSLKDFTFLYAQSKQLVVFETRHALRYYRTQFIEFLELIARCAELRFRNTSIQTIPLAKKIEFVLIDLLKMVGLKVSDKNLNDAEDHSSSGESEEDY